MGEVETESHEERPPHPLLNLTRGNFVFTKELGVGAMGTVFLAQHRSITRSKAVKVLHEDQSHSPTVVRRFFDEAVAASACQHEHIVTIEDCGDFLFNDRVHYYIEMEYLEGQDLGKMLRDPQRRRIEDVDLAVNIVSQAADALAAAHAHGVVHRDVKPENLFLARRAGRTDFVKVLDFGVAQLSGDLAVGPRTRTGEVFGTPLYMSPEQASGHRVDAKTDVWSLGVVLYYILSGVPPFYGDTFVKLAAKVQLDDPPPLERMRSDVPPGVLRAIEAAMQKNPARRPSMAAWRDMLLIADAAPRMVMPERSQLPPRSTRNRVELPRPITPAPPPRVLPLGPADPIPDRRRATPSHRLLRDLDDEEHTQPGAPLPFMEPQYTAPYGSRKSAAPPVMPMPVPGPTQPVSATQGATPQPHGPSPPPAMPRPRRRTR